MERKLARLTLCALVNASQAMLDDIVVDCEYELFAGARARLTDNNDFSTSSRAPAHLPLSEGVGRR